MAKYKCQTCERSYTIAGHLARHILKRHPGQGTANGAQPEAEKEVATFAYGYILAWLEGHATSAGVPPAVLTARVAKLLLATARGKMVGARD